MPQFVVRAITGTCQQQKIEDEPAASQPPVSGGIFISAPVGERGRNLPDDVFTIQEALNRVPPDQGGPKVPLKVDGICGPKTKGAIQTFQLRHFGWKLADSRVDPGKPTIAKLNEFYGPPRVGPPNPVVTVDVTDPQVEEGFKKIMTVHLEQALRWIRAAKFELVRALPVVETDGTGSGPIAQFDRKRLMERINLHFNVDKFSERRATLEKILSVYDNMEWVFKRTGDMWGVKAFEIYKGTKADQTTVAFTWYGGFFHSGEKISNEFGRVRQDTIFFMPKYIPSFAARQRAASGAIIHELAHFCGGPQNVGDIADHGYGGVLFSKLMDLPPARKIRNAECYANFAVHVGTGSVMYYQAV